MNRRFQGAFLIAALFCSPCFVGAETPARLKLGVIIPLSGGAASFSEGMKNGIEMALSDLSPSDRSLLEVYFEDDGLSSVRAVAAYQKLAVDHDIDAVFNFSSGTAHALAPILEKKKKVLVAVASDKKIVDNRRFAFNFWVTPETEAKVAAGEIKRLEYKKLARFTLQHEGPLAINAAVDRELQGSGVEIVSREEFTVDLRDFKPFLARLKKAGEFDAVDVLLFPPGLGVFAMQYKQAGFTKPIFSIEVLDDLSEIKAARGALEGAWYVSAAAVDPAFSKRYAERFPGTTEYAAGNGYEFIKLAVEAAKRGGGAEGFREYLATLRDFKGVLGTISSTGDGRFNLPAGLKVVRGDKVEFR